MKRRSEQLGLDFDEPSIPTSGIEPPTTPAAPTSSPGQKLAPPPDEVGDVADALPASAATALRPQASRLPLPDEDARARIATELHTNLLVEAGAGSGKTTALVSRMVALVREGVADVTEIAAVTFTRKAAGELRERFQEALERERGAPGHPPDVRARLERALQELDRAFMGTIHAFCARLLRERPIEAGIDPGFLETTAPEANRLAARFWSLHLERLAASGDPILGELEDVGLTPADLRGLYDKLRENLDVEYPIDPSPPPDPASVAQVRADVDALLDEARRLMPAEEPEKGWDELQLRLNSVNYVRKYRRWHDDRVFLDALAELATRNAWKVTQNRWSDTAAGKAAAKRLEDRANQLLTGDAKRLLEEWWAYRYPIAMRFALGAARELEKHRRASGHLDFQDLLALAARLLRTSPAARDALGARWRRLLVDEFQDTDPLQAEVVFLLTSPPGSDGGDWTRAVPRPGALFVVGDPKQSIYRFRRADIALYMQVRKRFAELGDVLELVANFRSGKPVADFVNAAFAPPLGFPLEGHTAQAAFAELSPHREVPATLEGVFFYMVDPDGGTREALSRWSARALADWIARRVGPGGDRRPGDFLILTRKKDQLEAYARALEGRNLPVRVSGAGVGVEAEVAELTLLLEALTDPDDPSATLAVLVGLFFGIDHSQLLAHRQAGLGFDFRLARTPSDEHPTGPVEAALHRMKRWWELARREPADVVVQRIASDLGLLAYAAAGELGSIRAGALAYVLDAVRSAGLAGDTSLAGALAALDTAMQDEEAEAPLEPGRSDTIRLMNVHKAKGLEAKVVILAAPYGEWDHPIDRHIERSAEGHARGWLRVEQKKSEFSVRTLARPLGWSRKEAAEREFGEAEDVRLLYVACTRAGEELVVARNRKRPEKSPWSALEQPLDLHALPLHVRDVPAPERAELETAPEVIRAAVHAADESRARAASATFAFDSVTRAAKGAAPVQAALPPAEDEEAPPPPVPASGGTGGYEWGSAVHGVLEAAVRGARGERLRAVARSLLLELDREVRNGEPTELDALLETAERVMTHDVWRRARASGRMLAEVPFTVERLDGRPLYLEGVIDLAFREADGWVIVDYKTDRGDDPTFQDRRESYREQLRIYSDAWERLSGESVKERLLWFVRSGVIEAVPQRRDVH